MFLTPGVLTWSPPLKKGRITAKKLVHVGQMSSEMALERMSPQHIFLKYLEGTAIFLEILRVAWENENFATPFESICRIFVIICILDMSLKVALVYMVAKGI